MKIPPKIKAVIFDLDGLLIDSQPYWEKGDRLLLKKLGVKSYDDQWLKQKMVGRGQRECAQIFIKKFQLNESIDSFIKKRWQSLYALLMEDLRLMSGTKMLIENLAKESLVLAVATGGHSKEKTEEILRKLNIAKFFKLIVSGLDVKRSKPFPDIYIECAKRLNSKPEECLVFEDAVNGVLSAKAAGMVVFGINADEKTRQELSKAGADKVFESLREVQI